MSTIYKADKLREKGRELMLLHGISETEALVLAAIEISQRTLSTALQFHGVELPRLTADQCERIEPSLARSNLELAKAVAQLLDAPPPADSGRAPESGKR